MAKTAKRVRGRPFVKGHKRIPGSGRAKGTPNKVTEQMRELVQLATAEAGGGGSEGALKYLVMQAKKRPGPFLALLGKTIEKQVSVDVKVRERVRLLNFTGLDLEDPKVRKKLGPSILGLDAMKGGE